MISNIKYTEDVISKRVSGNKCGSWNEAKNQLCERFETCQTISALNHISLKTYTTLGYIVSPIPSSRGLVKQYNQELCTFKFKTFHQEASVETIKLNRINLKGDIFRTLDHFIAIIFIEIRPKIPMAVTTRSFTVWGTRYHFILGTNLIPELHDISVLLIYQNVQSLIAQFVMFIKVNMKFDRVIRWCNVI